MSSVANPQPELPNAEELVAYLDGELPPDDCRRVERRLAEDDDYRQRLRDLDQAWEALDALPATRADDDLPAPPWSSPRSRPGAKYRHRLPSRP
jgi:anti-sigma factor RsiW